MIRFLKENKLLDKNDIKFSWDLYTDYQYENFEDYGNNLIVLNDLPELSTEEAIDKVNKSESKIASACTTIIKKNKKDEVIVGRNMDLEATNTPAVISSTSNGKYKTINLFYAGNTAKYKYDELNKMDKDIDYLRIIPFLCSDVINSKGLYIEANMREPDPERDNSCKGTNKDKPKCSMAMLTTLVAQNCKTVKEALEFVKNEYSWTSVNIKTGTGTVKWNTCFIIGDATGEYGLIEFCNDQIYYTPYANGQGNYYIHPLCAEYSNYGSGYGRFAAALEGLEDCKTEKDMFENVQKASGRVYNQQVGALGYSDTETSLQKRRKMSLADLKKKAKDEISKKAKAIKNFYIGDKKDLREEKKTWTSSFTIGYNCNTKHMILRLWEDDDIIIDIKF